MTVDPHPRAGSAGIPAGRGADRSRALDVLRGATVALMIGVNNPGSWNHLYPPLAHAQWHGCTPTDLVFPFFLFAVGNAMAFTMPALSAAAPAAFWGKLLRRTLLIFALGLLLNAAPFVRWQPDGSLGWRDWEQLRLMGVLQRIALAWCAATLVVRFGGPRAGPWLPTRLRRGPPEGEPHDRGTRIVLPAVAVVLLGYWALCVAFGAPGDPYSLEGFFGTAVDRALLGPQHLYRGEGVPFDPEGLASTLPAIAQVLLGYWVGVRVRAEPASWGAVARLFTLAAGLLALAYLWQLAMPINKKLWTSSYVLLSTGLAVALLALLVQALDLQRRGGAWVRFCEVHGRNALFVYVMSGLIPRLDGLLRWPSGMEAPRWWTPTTWAAKNVFEPIAPDPRFGSLLFALANVAAYGALAWWLDRRRIYIRV
jgi:predicted acyltransferase